MAQSPEGPAGAPPPQPNVAGFVLGILLGLAIGGTVLTLLFFFFASWVAELLPGRAAQSTAYVFLGIGPALALGWWAVVRTRHSLNPISGILIGLAAGMLGGVSLCGVLVGGLSNMR